MKEFGQTVAKEEKCVTISHTYVTQSGKPYTLKFTAIIRRNDTITLLNNTGSNIWDFRSIDKDFFIALIQGFAQVSQHEALAKSDKEE